MKDNGSNYIVGYDTADETKKIFQFEIDANGVKNGWFTQFDPKNLNSYSIWFENGKAKKLSYTKQGSLYKYSLNDNVLEGMHTIYYPNGRIKEYGSYEDNARVRVWSFYDSSGRLRSEGAYYGDYRKIFYNVKNRLLYTLDRHLDTIKVEKFTRRKYDSLKKVLAQEWGVIFPYENHFKEGIWKYYDANGLLVRQEFYDKGRFIRKEDK